MLLLVIFIIIKLASVMWETQRWPRSKQHTGTLLDLIVCVLLCVSQVTNSSYL